MFVEKINHYVPFTKVDKGPDNSRIVYGVMTDETPDAEGDIIEYEASKAAVAGWQGNIREMHSRSAVGKALEVECDDSTRQVMLRAKIVDPVAVMKIDEGVYTGYSIGGVGVKRAVEAPNRVKAYSLVETSVVDAPANPSSVFSIVKVSDLDGDGDEGGEPEAPAAGAAPAGDSEPVEKAQEPDDGAPEAPAAAAGDEAVEKATIVVQEQDPSTQYTLEYVMQMLMQMDAKMDRLLAMEAAEAAEDAAEDQAEGMGMGDMGDDDMGMSLTKDDDVAGDDVEMAAEPQMVKVARPAVAETPAQEAQPSVQVPPQTQDAEALNKAIGLIQEQQEELRKAVGEIGTLRAELEKLKNTPLPGGPILHSGAPGARLLNGTVVSAVEKSIGSDGIGATGGGLGDELATLQKMQAEERDPMLKARIGERIALHQIRMAQG